MTREEQLDWLCRLRSEIYVYMPKEWLTSMKNALDMAIKALEQEPTTKNDLGVDCISRAEAIKCLECDFDITGKENMKTVVNYINSAHDKIVNLPRVKQEPKTGHWILTDVEGNRVWHCNCSECGKEPLDYIGGSENWWLIKNNLPPFCPTCGSRNEVENGNVD